MVIGFEHVTLNLEYTVSTRSERVLQGEASCEVS